MIINIEGFKYDLEICLEKARRSFCFYIRATCKSNRRTSCINNLNAILSELNFDPRKPRFADSSWIVSKKEASCFADVAKAVLSDSQFLSYLEKKLHEDRLEGEWENISHV
ncbi:MAG: hypothetical protein AMJ91_03440 [candidate division Zixibacteria bacterium SM23_73_3]|nr:MAG: hypothetical protein AMJ91_03440 [candidate division Zixibacteria bacterium SM23_73_3]